MNKGDSWELKVSEKLHDQGLPLLISPLLLRSKNCGQIDLAYFKENTCVVVETKNKPIISRNQKNRLTRALSLLALIFKKKIYFFISTPKEEFEGESSFLKNSLESKIKKSSSP